MQFQVRFYLYPRLIVGESLAHTTRRRGAAWKTSVMIFLVLDFLAGVRMVPFRWKWEFSNASHPVVWSGCAKTHSI